MISHKELNKIEYLSNKYDETNMPTYISYPTTGFWRNKITEADFVENAKQITMPFLYFHFPYCKKACYYCVCYKTVANDISDLDTYIDFIMKEFNRKLDLAGIETLKDITQMHWGGGTPTYMTGEQIGKAFRRIEKRVEFKKSESSGLSIEAYPDEEMVTYEKLKVLRDLGFTEISFGIQDFDKKTQFIINRNYDVDVLRKLVDQARGLGMRIHIDLCYGLPFQGQNEFEYTLNEIMKIKPSRIATYPYSHYPFLFPAQKLIPTSSIPNSFIKVLLAKMADDIFLENDYAKIGFDHFVRKDNVMYENYKDKRVVRDFMGYSIDKRKELFGFGNSAISFLNGTFFHNIAKMEEYCTALSAGETGINYSMSHNLSKDDFIRKQVILKNILTYMEIDKKALEDEYGIAFDNYFDRELEKINNFGKDDLLVHNNSKISLSKYGEYFSRHIAYTFDKYYNK